MGMLRDRRSATWMAVALVAALVAAGCSSDDGSDGARSTTTTAGSATSAVPAEDDLRLNQIQVIGTHNSFHQEAEPEEVSLLAAIDQEQSDERAYTHAPLPTQLDEQRIRQFELDIFADEQGGLYADPALRRQAGLGPYEVPELAEPGTKVLHEQDVDYHSVCPTLVGCLTEIRTWSDANPDHVPVAIGLQFKDGPLIFPVPDQAVPEKWTPAQMRLLDEEILSVFDRDRILTPDDVQGEAATLEEAVLDGGWPTLAETRGKVLFLIVNAEPYRTFYLDGADDLAGRLLFTNAEPGNPDASYVSVDDPLEDAARIADLVGKGYLVRTRADANNEEPATGDTTRLEAALASGAQWVSTDYPGPDGAEPAFGTGYVAQLPGFVAARCNPITAPPGCVDAGVEP